MQVKKENIRLQILSEVKIVHICALRGSCMKSHLLRKVLLREYYYMQCVLFAVVMGFFYYLIKQTTY